jgi:tRNA (guanine37-N1)-methyltransferase
VDSVTGFGNTRDIPTACKSIPTISLPYAVARMIPEVLGSSDAHNEESIYSGLLEYPQYTKPRQYEGLDVPEVLISGNHKLIHLWQFEKSLELTKERRPDLLEDFLKKESMLTKDEKKILRKIMEQDG